MKEGRPSVRTGGLCLLVTVNVDGYLNRIAAHVTAHVGVYRFMKRGFPQIYGG